MKVITIKQPWASLIINGYKKYEFRTWNTKFRGEILIHSSKKYDKKELERFKNYNIDFPLGSIIGKVNIVDSILVDNNLKRELLLENKEVYKNIIDNNDYKGYAFKLENVKKIKPIKINGKLGLWNIDEWQFGSDNDYLVNLVLKGEKTATTSLYKEYLDLNEELPKINNNQLLLFESGKVACITRNKEVLITEFKNITSDLAYLEGEGDKSLEYYKKVHTKIFKEIDSNFNENSLVVFEIFEVI